jgi:peptide/nickel transport system substrate-binding protein
LFAVALGAVALGALKNPDTLTVLWVDDIRGLDPGYAASTPESWPIYQVFDRLINFDGPAISEFVPCLATVVPSVANGLITTGSDGKVYYTFPIQRGVYCHYVGVKASDGSIQWKAYDTLTDAEKAKIVPGYGEITASDVKYSLLHAMLLGVSWMSNCFTSMLTGTEYPDVGAMALAFAGVDSMDEVDKATLVRVYDYLANQIQVDESTYTVTIALNKPFPATLGLLALPFGGSIVDKEWCVAQGAWPGTPDTWKDYYQPTLEADPLFEKENGSGPFLIESWDRSQKQVVFERFDGYFRGPAKLQRVVLRSVTEWTTRFLALQAGDADFAGVPLEFVDQVAAMPGMTLVRGLPSVVTTNLFFLWPVREGSSNIGSGKLDGNGIPPDFFSDIDVREGFCYAMDYDVLIEQIMLGQTVQARGPTVKGIMGYRDDSPVYSYDPEKATEHFKKAWGGQLWGKGFKFTAFYIAGSTTWQAALQLEAQNLAKINPKFQMDVQGIQWSAFAELLWGSPEPGAAMVICNWGPDYSDPGGPNGAASYYLDVHGTVAGFSGSGYRQLLADTFQSLLDRAWSLSDPAEREPIYAQLQAMTYEYATSVFLWQDPYLYLGPSYIKGWVVNAMTYGAPYWYTYYKQE